MPMKAPTHRLGPSREERKAEADKARPSAAKRGYNHNWRKIRTAVLSDEPLCRHCVQRGEVVPAEEVDHIDGCSWHNWRANLRPLCKPCHSRRTAKDQAFKAKAREILKGKD